MGQRFSDTQLRQRGHGGRADERAAGHVAAVVRAEHTHSGRDVYLPREWQHDDQRASQLHQRRRASSADFVIFDNADAYYLDLFDFLHIFDLDDHVVINHDIDDNFHVHHVFYFDNNHDLNDHVVVHVNHDLDIDDQHDHV